MCDELAFVVDIVNTVVNTTVIDDIICCSFNLSSPDHNHTAQHSTVKGCHLPGRVQEQSAHVASCFIVHVVHVVQSVSSSPGDAEPVSRRRQLNKLNRSRQARVRVGS